MRSTLLKLLAGVVGLVALGSVILGLASPDGSVGPVNQGPRPATAAPSTSSPPAADDPAEDPADDPEQASSPDLAPATVAGTWPGRPSGTKVTGRTVDWCGAVSTTGAAEAVRVFGQKAVDAAACAAVGFVFDQRYSRLSLPRSAYRTSDFDDVLPTIDATTVARIYRPRISSFVSRPGSDTAGEQLGLVLFTARGTAKGAAHASAGPGHVFYGPAFTTRGYRGRAVWINPSWSTVAISVDRSAGAARIKAGLTASAALPVYASATDSDAMLTLPTKASFLLSPGSSTSWRISGWTISRGDAQYGRLSVR